MKMLKKKRRFEFVRVYIKDVNRSTADFLCPLCKYLYKNGQRCRYGGVACHIKINKHLYTYVDHYWYVAQKNKISR